MLKTVEYRTGNPEENGRVAYAVLDDRRVVFSGLTKKGSTINYAEEIIAGIASQEGIKPQDFSWFDLQTHQGYPNRKPGNFEFDELTLGIQEELGKIGTSAEAAEPGKKPGAIVVEAWRPCPLPLEMATLFAENIGKPDDGQNVWMPVDAKKAGYTPTEYHSGNSRECIDLVKMQKAISELMARIPLQLRAVVAEFCTASPSMVWIVVDQAEHPDLLEASRGERFCVWQHDTSEDN